MKKTPGTIRIAPAESIARKADRGESVSSYFTNKGKMIRPLQTDAIGLSEAMLNEVDKAARKLKVTRQALIKQFIRRGRNEEYRSQKQRKAG